MSQNASSTRAAEVVTLTEYVPYPWATMTAASASKAGDKYSILSKYGFDGKMEETCIWNRLVFPVGADENQFTNPHLFNLQELPDGNESSGSQTYNARLFIKDFHNIKGARPARVSTSNQLGWRKPSFALNTT